MERLVSSDCNSVVRALEAQAWEPGFDSRVYHFPFPLYSLLCHCLITTTEIHVHVCLCPCMCLCMSVCLSVCLSCPCDELILALRELSPLLWWRERGSVQTTRDPAQLPGLRDKNKWCTYVPAMSFSIFSPDFGVYIFCWFRCMCTCIYTSELGIHLLIIDNVYTCTWWLSG